MKSPSPPRHRQGALWPWLVTPLVTLGLFYVLHTERKATPPLHAVPEPGDVMPGSSARP